MLAYLLDYKKSNRKEEQHILSIVEIVAEKKGWIINDLIPPDNKKFFLRGSFLTDLPVITAGVIKGPGSIERRKIIGRQKRPVSIGDGMWIETDMEMFPAPIEVSIIPSEATLEVMGDSVVILVEKKEPPLERLRRLFGTP